MSRQLLTDQRSDLGTEELNRVHRERVINMGRVQFETLNVHQLVQSDDLLSHGFGTAEEQRAIWRD